MKNRHTIEKMRNRCTIFSIDLYWQFFEGVCKSYTHTSTCTGTTIHRHFEGATNPSEERCLLSLSKRVKDSFQPKQKRFLVFLWKLKGKYRRNGYWMGQNGNQLFCLYFLFVVFCFVTHFSVRIIFNGLSFPYCSEGEEICRYFFFFWNSFLLEMCRSLFHSSLFFFTKNCARLFLLKANSCSSFSFKTNPCFSPSYLIDCFSRSKNSLVLCPHRNRIVHCSRCQVISF